jgi:hypothetical protein
LLEPGKRSTLDALDRDSFTLVTTRDDPEVEHAFATAAAAQGIPFKTVRFTDPVIAKLYENSLVLVRPDQHVAWRGDVAPTDAVAIMRHVTGHLEVTQ